MNYQQISFFDLLLATSLILITLVISSREKLGLERELLIGAVRSFLQLMFVGYLLQVIFDLQQWYLTLLALGLMLFIAGINAWKQQQQRYQQLFWILTLGIAFGSLLVLAIVAGLILKVKPWYAPQYLIPLAGMLIGNSMVGAALAANKISTAITQHRAEIELALSLGATSRQAVDPYLKESLKTAMMPTISTMMTVGIVQLPGMMTGQIIAGTDPALAVRYQIVVVYMIAAATALTVILVTLWLIKIFFSPDHQLVYTQIPKL